MLQVSYSPEGARGLLAEGASSREETTRKLIEEMGGSVEAFYYAFGDSDVVEIVDFPDNETAAAFSLALNASGYVSVKTTILMTPKEIDAATKKTVNFRPPGK